MKRQHNTTFLFLLTLVILSISTSSCVLSKKPLPSVVPDHPDLVQPTTVVGNSAEELGDIADNIGESADSIDTHVIEIENLTPPENRPAIQPSLEGIGNETDELRSAQVSLAVMQDRLSDAELELQNQQAKIDIWTKYAKEREAENKALNEKIRDLEDKQNRALKEKLAWIIIVSIAGIGVCLVLAFWTRSKMAIAVAAGLGITIAVSLAITIYMQQIALITISIVGVALLLGLGYMAYYMFIGNKSDEELVRTGEIMKQYLPVAARKELFGAGAAPGTIDQIQSKSTKERVTRIRSYNDRQRGFSIAPRLTNNQILHSE